MMNPIDGPGAKNATGLDSTSHVRHSRDVKDKPMHTMIRTPTAGTQDGLSLSTLAVDLQKVLRHTSSPSPERTQKLLELRYRIQEGTYHVPSDLLAQKILNARG